MVVFEDFPLNIQIFRLVNSHHSGVFDLFFLYFSYSGSGWVLIPCLFYLIVRRAWTETKVFILAIVIESLVVWSLKILLTQPRPALLLKDVHLVISLYKGSFPSGDTAMAFTIATVFGHRSRTSVRVMLFLWATLIGYGRLYLGVHFPLDVVSGAVIGLLSGIIALRTIRTR